MTFQIFDIEIYHFRTYTIEFVRKKTYILYFSARSIVKKLVVRRITKSGEPTAILAGHGSSLIANFELW